MVASDGGGGGKLTKKVLGLGYWVQGFRCFPWLVVSFYLKDGLNVDPSILQILQSSANLPMVGKPLYGLVSDSVYISGQHRVPYIALGGTLIFTLFAVSMYPFAFSLWFDHVRAKLHTFATFLQFVVGSVMWGYGNWEFVVPYSKWTRELMNEWIDPLCV